MYDFERELVNLGAKARDGKITLEDMTGGSFTISNGGVFGSMLSTPIINPPQSAIPVTVGMKARVPTHSKNLGSRISFLQHPLSMGN